MIAARNYPINCGLATSEFSRTFAKRRVEERSFDIKANESRRIATPGQVSQVVVQDRIFARHSSASYATDFFVDSLLRVPQYNQPVSLTSASPGVLSDPQGGVATYQGDGPCRLFATSRDGEVSSVTVVASLEDPAVVDEPDGWVAESLAQHATNQIDNRLTGELPIFSQQDGVSFTRNPHCWAAGIDLTCASPWNSTGGLQRAGTLVSPRHVVFVKHSNFHPSVNAAIKFVTQNNEVVSRTLTAIETHPQYYLYKPDIVVGVLDSDVPESISFAEVLPTDWTDYLPSLNAANTVPVLRLNRTESASVAEFRGAVAETSMFYLSPASQTRQAFYETIAPGDSGNPVFLVVNNKPVLIGTFTFGGAGGGTFLAAHITAVNAMMSSLGGGYSLTIADLTGFPNYGD